MVLMNPFVLRMTRLQPLDVWKHWAREIEKLGKIVTRLTKDFNAVHIDTQKIFDQVAGTSLPKPLDLGWGTSFRRRVMN